jgi:hypothetical protein
MRFDTILSLPFIRLRVLFVGKFVENYRAGEKGVTISYIHFIFRVNSIENI